MQRDSPGCVSAEDVVELPEVSVDEEDEVDLVGALPAQGRVKGGAQIVSSIKTIYSPFF